LWREAAKARSKSGQQETTGDGERKDGRFNDFVYLPIQVLKADLWMAKIDLFRRLHDPRLGPSTYVVEGVTVAVSDTHPVITFKKTVGGYEHVGAVYIHRTELLDLGLFNRRVQYYLDDFIDSCVTIER
jgi:hypothetical protein